MRHPDPQRLRSVARRLQDHAAHSHVLDESMASTFKGLARHLRPRPGRRIVSMSDIISTSGRCGTYACIAGHWMDIRLRDADVAAYMKKHPRKLAQAPRHAYSWGLRLLSRDLGLGKSAKAKISKIFKLRRPLPSWGSSPLARWADANPELWGNLAGQEIFGPHALERGAWTESGASSVKGLGDIAQHLLRVAGRIEAEQRISQLRDAAARDMPTEEESLRTEPLPAQLS